MKPKHGVTTYVDSIQSGFVVGAARVLKATEILCIKDGDILQLWIDLSSPYREWRKLPAFEEASALYNCTEIK
jgi:hypothetical protein